MAFDIKNFPQSLFVNIDNATTHKGYVKMGMHRYGYPYIGIVKFHYLIQRYQGTGIKYR